jgi:hypothetical protein
MRLFLLAAFCGCSDPPLLDTNRAYSEGEEDRRLATSTPECTTCFLEGFAISRQRRRFEKYMEGNFELHIGIGVGILKVASGALGNPSTIKRDLVLCFPRSSWRREILGSSQKIILRNHLQ